MSPVDVGSADWTCVAAGRCVNFDRSLKRAGVLADPAAGLCGGCLTVAERDVRILLYDYIDLEQMLPPSLGRALDSQSRFGRAEELPAPLRMHVEALQREIWWVATAWAEVMVERQRLADPPWLGRGGGPGDGSRRRVRDGYAVKWAVDLLAPRLPDLARVGFAVFADYPDVDPGDASRFSSVELAELSGAQGVLHLRRLRARAQATLGRVRRTTRVPGRCGCRRARNFLFRDEPRFERDPCPVYCGACNQRWTPEQYERFIGLMRHHPELADVEGVKYKSASVG